MVVKVNPPKVVEVVPAVQNYDWGMLGSNSLVAKLSGQSSNSIIDEAKPYAELWMGTHPNAPSKVRTTEGIIVSSLHDYLGKELPFLFKVLSVGKALSIQAHPDSSLAKKLHEKDPKNYRDPNHKPEMTIALTPFEALCGFRPLSSIIKDIEVVPELSKLVDSKAIEGLKEAIIKVNDSDKQKEALKMFFSQFITANQDIVVEQIEKFIDRIKTDKGPNKPTSLEELCLKLNGQYPREVGCFCVFLLNHVKLAPGEAIFLAANEPHAYLSGECIECMAPSDNVVRAGLTPKFRDVETLVEMLTYKTYEPLELAMQPEKLIGRPNSLLYKPPVPEFAVIKISLGVGIKEKIITTQSEAILLCVKGELTLESAEGTLIKSIKPGSVLLLCKHSEHELFSFTSDSLLFQAFAQD